MKKRIVLIFISAAFLLAGCGQNYDEENQGMDTSVVENEPSAADNIQFVFGIAYDIANYQAWIDAYNHHKGQTIIILRNVDNPSIILVYEQTNSMFDAKERSYVLTTNEFIEQSQTLGDPVKSYYEVKLFQPTEEDYKIYVALIFQNEDSDNWISKVKENAEFVTKHGLIPVGIGVNADNKSEVYLLAALENYLEFKKNTNTPKEIGKLYEAIGVPGHTMISYWSAAKF